jgi:hypothetical protein
MPRGRAKLTEKQERILIQAQLMGLTPQDMQRISNRLIALQKEAEEIRSINEVTQGYTWDEVVRNDHFKISTPEGYVVEAVRGKKGKTHWNSFSWDYDITITKPGTRFKARRYKNKTLTCDYDWKKSLMPAQSKELYSLIYWCKTSMKYDNFEVV